MARPKLTLYLDIISPFAYMAYYITKHSPTFQQCDVTYIPIFLGGVMQATGNTSPVHIKNKGKWLEREREKWARAFDIPIVVDSPKPFPQSTMSTQRALCAVSLMYPEKLDDCFAALYQAFWVEKQTPIGKPEVFGPALTKVLGEDGWKKVLDSIGTAEIKKLLKDNSDKAFDDGAFGLPWFVATNAKGESEAFWGVDHLGQVVDHLGLERQGPGFRAML